MRLISLVFLFLISTINSRGQEIKGFIKDVGNNSIENASITLWNNSQKEKLISNAYSDDKGFFVLRVNPEFQTGFLVVSSLGYKTKTLEIKKNEITSIILEDDKIDLPEVEIKRETPIKVNKDTTYYKPESFLNGTEVKVEDLLKKLPGITVNENTGQIKFKDKNIETVLLEGDDLFGGNYTIGTKNISVDMVEEVQAIEHYSANHLLRNIESTENTVLNLKIKKGKTDFSGELMFANGYERKFFLANEATGLGISKKLKSFGVLSQQNYGVDSQNYENSLGEVQDNRFCNEAFFAKRMIQDISSQNYFGSKRTNYNNLIFLNSNVNYKISPKLSVKSNFFKIYDNIKTFENNKTVYKESNGNEVENSLFNQYSKTPKIYRFENKLMFNISNLSLLEGIFDVKIGETNSSIKSNLNSNENFNSWVNTKDFYLKSNIKYTQKIGQNRVLQFTLLYGKNNLPQNLILSPSLDYTSNNESVTNSSETSEFTNEIIQSNIKYLTKKKIGKDYILFGFAQNKQPYLSYLFQNNTPIEDFYNKMDYATKSLYLEYGINFNWHKLNNEITVCLKDYDQKLNEQQYNKTILNAAYLLKYEWTKNSYLYFNNEFSQKRPEASNLYLNPVIISNNTLQNNLPSLNLTQTFNSSLGYNFTNLFKQLTLNIGFDYFSFKNSFITNISFSERLISLTYFQTFKNIELKKVFISIDKKFKKINTSSKTLLSFSTNDFYNTLNNGVLRKNHSEELKLDTFLTTFFQFPVNLEERIIFSSQKFYSNEQLQNIRNTVTIKNSIVIKPSKNLISKISLEHFNTDLKSKTSITFMDFNISYKSKNKVVYKFLANNLFDNNSFEVISKNDYSTSLFQSQLLRRHFLISANITL